ncbi:uncharacterized protein LOC113464437 isoform X2 [Ceratina calcarata]|uniref:Uncharacterized protein LOC113464437 isoform X2 n=1 Tax=Ceratina calcarata TaxID=156304 RepID=A0AAJ7S244_9HYME|nr:uncharacterized protein LOC113464437 isoform X2 [Ceratina calcarata]
MPATSTFVYRQGFLFQGDSITVLVGSKGYGSVKNNFLPLICGGLEEEKSPGPGDIKILFEGCLG